MKTMNLFEEVNAKVQHHVFNNMKELDAASLGLDVRCGHVFVDEESIAVSTSREGSLRYYGGFEYHPKELRKELGEWVFYFVDQYGDYEGDRVTECLQRAGLI